jgi:chromosome segregation ATPase
MIKDKQVQVQLLNEQIRGENGQTKQLEKCRKEIHQI